MDSTSANTVAIPVLITKREDRITSAILINFTPAIQGLPKTKCYALGGVKCHIT